MIKNIIASTTLATSMLVSSFALGQEEQSQVTIEFQNFAVRGVSIDALSLIHI